jgi:4-amino-4-deoxy-L-arabinose transferase-like glycosyltransferase
MVSLLRALCCSVLYYLLMHTVQKDTIPIVWITVISLLLLCYRIESGHSFAYDEGFFAQIAHNTIEYGTYGVWSRDAIVPAQLSVGPTVLLPVAATYQVFGVGIWQSRLVVALAGWLTLLLLYRLTSRLYHRTAALIATTLVLIVFFHQRGLYGEIPAIGFLLAGVWCWWQAMQTRSALSSGAAGLAFGMMLVSKPQMLLVAPAFAVALVANWRYYRCWPRSVVLWMVLLFPLPLLLSFLYQGSMHGLFTYGRFIAGDLTDSSSASVFPSRWWVFLWFHLQARYPLLLIGMISLLASLRDGCERSARGLVRGTLLLITVTALGWHVVLSPGWYRYGVAAYTLLDLFIAVRLVDLVAWLERRLAIRPPRLLRAFQVGIPVAIPLAIFIPLATAPPANRDLLAMAATIEQTVPPDALIETYEWQFEVLTRRRYSHIPLAQHVHRVRYFRFGEEEPPPAYAFWQLSPDYLVRGPTGNELHAYTEWVGSECLHPLAQHGRFELSRVHGAECFETAPAQACSPGQCGTMNILPGKNERK